MFFKKKMFILLTLPALLLCGCSKVKENNSTTVPKTEISYNHEVEASGNVSDEDSIIYNYIYIEFGGRTEYYHISSWKRYKTENEYVDLEITLAVSKKTYRWYKQGMYYVLQTEYDIKYDYNGLIE